MKKRVYILVEGEAKKQVTNEADKRILRKYNPFGLSLRERYFSLFIAGAVIIFLGFGTFHVLRILSLREDVSSLRKEIGENNRLVRTQDMMIRQQNYQIADFKAVVDDLSVNLETERLALGKQQIINRDVINDLQAKIGHMEESLPGITKYYFGPTEELLKGLNRFVDEPYVEEDIETYKRAARLHPASLGETGERTLISNYGVHNYIRLHDFLKLPFENLEHLVVLSHMGLRNVYKYVSANNVEYLYTKYHLGTDFANLKNPRIRAPYDCWIVIYRDKHPETSNYIGLGRMAVLEFRFQTGIYRYIIGHIAQDMDIPFRPTPDEPVFVEKGTFIGNIGNSGYTTGFTAHLECWYWNLNLKKWQVMDIFTRDKPRMQNRLYIDADIINDWKKIRYDFIM